MSVPAGTRRRLGIETRLRKYDPRDTDGNGDCGHPVCPFCSDSAVAQRWRYKTLMGLAKSLFSDVFTKRTLTQHVESLFPRAGSMEHYLVALVWDYEDHDSEISPMEYIDYIGSLGWDHLRLATQLRDVARMLHPEGD